MSRKLDEKRGTEYPKTRFPLATLLCQNYMKLKKTIINLLISSQIENLSTKNYKRLNGKIILINDLSLRRVCHTLDLLILLTINLINCLYLYSI